MSISAESPDKSLPWVPRGLVQRTLVGNITPIQTARVQILALPVAS